MFNVEISCEDIFISNIEKEDFDDIENWMKHQVGECYEIMWINISELRDRLVEYYISGNEIFLKLIKDDCIIGVFKGRIEEDKLLIWCYIIENDLRRNGVGSFILEIIIDYFKKNYGITNYITGVVGDNDGSIKFWNKNKFNEYRISKNFFSNGKEEKDMLLLKRNLEKSF
ncbi:GNAT family N-acetyltransferase [Clostridium oryzae]|uniref:Acetyltransferase (GNAT) family protein n=1 Tax=Clostridium oryzae TaxID=1450648 RepID=A0A1V4IUY4_9CLOT|nr:GNAT family N-acetyltransferase [Clostridium oryzae]OPJ63746.1 acetyltransferase (GNAT) family protein [Clostridium oryzae]